MEVARQCKCNAGRHMTKKLKCFIFILCVLFLAKIGQFLGHLRDNENPKEENRLLTMHCATGRLGNQLALFATLHGVGKLNNRTVGLQKCHADRLRRYFNLSSIPIVEREASQEVGYALKSYLRSEDIHVPRNATVFIGHPYPTSYTFFDHTGATIRQLLTFRKKFQQHALKVLQEAAEKHKCDPADCVFVGIHVRLTDYAVYMKKRNGRRIDMNYFRKGMDFFRQKYGPTVLFVVVSDNREWCRINFGEFPDVFLSPDVSDPGYDMALMMAANKSIISYGTFSFWCAYLREAHGGETVRFDDYLLPGTPFLVENPYDKVYPSRWIAISSTPPDYWNNFLKKK